VFCGDFRRLSGAAAQQLKLRATNPLSIAAEAFKARPTGKLRGPMATHGTASAADAPGGCHVIKLVSEYLADALKFEHLAAEEKDEQLKLSFLQQASAYRKLAEKRAKDLGKPLDQSSQ
jgi:hypothetical protein